MTTFIIRRLLQSIACVILVTIIVFFAMRLLPGDPIRMLVTAQSMTIMTEEEIEFLRHENGLDRPLVEQYFTWMGGILKGDWGRSITVEDAHRRRPRPPHPDNSLHRSAVR